VSTSSQAELPETNSADAGATPRSAFVTTHWSVVVKAGQSDTPRVHQALSHLCETYWYPLYTYVRKRGYSPEDAQDLTQEFFARLLERKWVSEANQERGRFRSFLLSAMNHFLADEWDKARAQKRGGGVTKVPLQLGTAETRYGVEPADPITPEQSFERRWALTLLEQVLKCLQQDYEQEGKAKLFAELRFAISADQAAIPYAELAARLGMSEAAIRVSVYRLRKEYRQALRAQIAETVTDEAEVAAELAYLREILSR
jgi:RNA polymerase sigma-70 factor (ECF subfamily)